MSAFKKKVKEEKVSLMVKIDSNVNAKLKALMVKFDLTKRGAVQIAIEEAYKREVGS